LEEFGAEDPSYKYFVKLEEQGKKYVILDGQNRLKAIEDFLNNKFKISNCTLSAEDPGARPLYINAEGLYFKDLPELWQKRLQKTEVPFTILTEATTEDLHFEFIKLNDGEHLNAQEKRNALPGILAETVRIQAQEPAVDVDGKTEGKFYSDFDELFSKTETKRRGADFTYLRLLAITDCFKKGYFNSDKITELSQGYYDNMYHNDNIDKEVYTFTDRMTEIVVAMALNLKKTKKSQLKFQEFLTLYLFALVVYDRGFNIDIKNTNAITELAKRVYNDESKREAEFRIPDHLQARRSEISDKEWTSHKSEYSYEYWRGVTTRFSYLRNRYKALGWSFDTMIDEEDFESVLVERKNRTPRENIPWSQKLHLSEVQGWRCAFTGKKFDRTDIGPHVHAEHLLPKARGGDNDEENLAMVWHTVNKSKYTKKVHGIVKIAQNDHPEVYADYHDSLPTSQCLHKAYETEDDIHYLVIDVENTDFWINIREMYREEETPKPVIPPMTSTSSPSMQASV